MSGISSIGSSPASSGLSSSLTTNSLPNGGLSSVGASILSSGQAPDPATAAAGTTSGSTLSSYQAEYLNLQQYDDQELLYASFLSPEAGLANFDSVLEQAATLLGTPGSPGPALNTTATTSSSTSSTSTSSASSALTNVPSVASILAASDNEAQQTLTAYANAPVGSSILDYQA